MSVQCTVQVIQFRVPGAEFRLWRSDAMELRSLLVTEPLGSEVRSVLRIA